MCQYADRKRLFMEKKKVLLISIIGILVLLAGLVAEVVATLLLGYRGAAFDWFFVLIFSGYIGYDIAKSQAYPKTVDNAVDCALDIYIGSINLFIRLLSILNRRS